MPIQPVACIYQMSFNAPKTTHRRKPYTMKPSKNFEEIYKKKLDKRV